MSQDSPSLPFEAALSELEAIVQRLERGELTLDTALKDFERGIRLVRHCTQTLEAMEMRIEQLTVSEDGLIAVEPFDAPMNDSSKE